MIDENDILFKTILYCQRHKNTPDLHSFTVKIKNGIAFVDYKLDEVFYVKTITYDEAGKEISTEFSGTAIAVANRLDMFGADPSTIDM